ncbi:hypothetical protein ABTD98_20510, partial [Acinetobacter baumannii]
NYRLDPATADADINDMEPRLRHWFAVAHPYLKSKAFCWDLVWPLFVRGWERVLYLPGDGPLDRLFRRCQAEPDAAIASHLRGIGARWS